VRQHINKTGSAYPSRERQNLYFIALVPDRELVDKINDIKEEVKILTAAKSILKSPAHITVQKPFKRPDSEEHKIIESLRHFSSRQSPFDIELDSYDAFPPRVIFIRVRDHDRISRLHAGLKKVLTAELSFSGAELMDDIHPHVTLTTRYLTPSGFYGAWPLFKERKFSASFRARELCLLKHDGQKWNIFYRFEFES
jgi:2'-5' RNA ligase